MPPAKKPTAKKAAAKRVHVSESGREAAIVAGTSEREVHEALTGADKLPEKGQELGRPPTRPEFDPHAREVEVEEVRAPTAISMMCFVGAGNGLEERIREVIAYAEGRGLVNLAATIGELDEDLYDVIVNGP